MILLIYIFDFQLFIVSFPNAFNINLNTYFLNCLKTQDKKRGEIDNYSAVVTVVLWESTLVGTVMDV